MGPIGNLPRNRMVGIDRKRFGVLHRRGIWIWMRQHEPRHAIGQRRLADALWTTDQPGMRNAAAPVGGEQRRLGLTSADQIRRFAGMPDCHLLLGLSRAHAELAVEGMANR